MTMEVKTQAQLDALMTLMTPSGDEDARHKAIMDRITWCTQLYNGRPACINRHGTIYHVQPTEIRDVENTLSYYYGCRNHKGLWWRKDGAEYAVEFATQTKVSPPPSKPWEWCGTTMIFPDWHMEVQEQATAARAVKIGDTVTFSHKGQTYQGIVAGGRTRATIIVGHSKWHVPYTELTRV
jgi:hypothetical protein